MLVFLNVTDKFRKHTENTNGALHPRVFQGIDLFRERVCSAPLQVHPRTRSDCRKMVEMIF